MSIKQGRIAGYKGDGPFLFWGAMGECGVRQDLPAMFFHSNFSDNSGDCVGRVIGLDCGEFAPISQHGITIGFKEK
jgi:hypothetical protein